MEFGEKMGCHQLAERSFFFHGYQFPVCARCTGVIVGEIIAVILLLLSVRIHLLLSIIFLIPMGIDWGLQYFAILISTNWRRFLTGAIGGFGLTYCYTYVFLTLFRGLCELILC